MFDSKQTAEEPAARLVGVPEQLVALDYAQLAAVLRVQIDTLHRWVRAGRIRQPIYFGDRPRWTTALVRKIVAEGTKPAGTFPPADPKPATRSKAQAANVGRTKTPKRKPTATAAKPKVERQQPIPRKRGAK